MANVTTLPPPTQLPVMQNFLSIHKFIYFWTMSTYGLFPHLFAALLLASVYLKTRSVSATLVVAMILMSVSSLLGWLAFPVAAGFAWIVYLVFYKKNSYE